VGLVICHTADWHLGRTLHGASFELAHRRFLVWLCRQIAEHRVDVLVVAGDVFDRSVPPASAEALFYGFLALLAEQAPGIQVVVVAGNHDGPARLSAPAPLLARLGAGWLGVGRLGVHLVGGVPLDTSGAVDVDAMIVPLRTRQGVASGHLIAVPFLRPSDLSRIDGDDRCVVSRTRTLHERAVAAVRSRWGAEEGQLLAAVGHGHVRGGRLSPHSERPLLGGEEAAVPVDVFPRTISYVALGHLHLAQALDGGRVRYAGAPLPLAFSERSHPHQVVIVRVDHGAPSVEAVAVPRFVQLTRVEGDAGQSLEVEEAVARLESLGASEAERSDAESEHWVQVRVRLRAPRAALKRELAEALASGARRVPRAGPLLVSVDVERAGDTLLAPTPASAYAELAPEAVLARVWGSTSADPVPEALTRALHDAWEQARREHEEERAELPEMEMVGPIEVAS
jgi:exonuclease SbcD